MKRESIYDDILRFLREEEYYSLLADFISYHRIQGTPGMREGMEFIKKVMDMYGIWNKFVAYPMKPYERLYGFPYFKGYRPVRLEATLFMGKRQLHVDFDLNPFTFVQRSGNIKGRYRVVLEDAKDTKNKFVLVSDFKKGLSEYLYTKKSKGIVVYDPNAYEKARKKYQFWYYAPKEDEYVGIVLTNNEANKLKEHLSHGKKAYIEINTHSVFEDNTNYYLLSKIEGESKDAILYVAHTCHARGEANDNGSGATSLLYALITMKKMQHRGVLKKPPYTVYFLFVPEMWGSALFIEKEKDILNDIFAGFNFDMVGSDLQKTEGRVIIERPHGNLKTNIHKEFKKHVDRVHEYLDYPYAVYIRPFDGGSDHLLFQDIDMKIPMPMLIHWPCKYYHTDHDVISHIDPKAIWRNVILMASMPYLLKKDSIFIEKRTTAGHIGDVFSLKKKGVFIPLMDEDIKERIRWYKILSNKKGYINFTQFLYYIDGKRSFKDILHLVEKESGEKPDKDAFGEYIAYLFKKGVLSRL